MRGVGGGVFSVWFISAYYTLERFRAGSGLRVKHSSGSIISIREQRRSINLCVTANLHPTPPQTSPPSWIPFTLINQTREWMLHSVCETMHLLTFGSGLTSPATNALCPSLALLAARRAELMRTHRHKCLNNQKICLCLSTCCGSSCIYIPRDKFSLAL